MDTIDVYDKIRNGDYEVSLPYPRKPKKPLLSRTATSVEAREYAEQLEQWEKDVETWKHERDAYYKENSRLREKLKNDCLEEVGLLGHEKADKAWSYAWEHGHSSGDSEVYLVLQDIVELIL